METLAFGISLHSVTSVFRQATRVPWYCYKHIFDYMRIYDTAAVRFGITLLSPISYGRVGGYSM